MPLALTPMATAAAASSAFTATNIDDIFLLLLFFSGLKGSQPMLRPVQVVSGQFLGVAVLVLFSLGGFIGQRWIPQVWLGLLGLLPISIGVSQLLAWCQDAGSCQDGDGAPPVAGCSSALSVPLSAQVPFPIPLSLAGTVSVAALTVANGSDNIGVYTPLFARFSQQELLIALAVFVVMTALWCGLAWRLARLPGLADLLQRHGALVMPLVLLVLGGLILLDSHVLAEPALAVLVFALLGVMVFTLLRQVQALLPERSLFSPWVPEE